MRYCRPETEGEGSSESIDKGSSESKAEGTSKSKDKESVVMGEDVAILDRAVDAAPAQLAARNIVPL
jgi:hypothetical protein